MKTRVKLLIKNIEELATPTASGFRALRNAAIAIDDGDFVGIGPTSMIMERYSSDKIIDASGHSVVPGFVDPHTHLVYAGCRHRELVMRLQGKSYADILKEGGGIMDTVRKTRSATENDLYQEALSRLKTMIMNGTTTLEIKSGYGLDYETETKMLKVIQRLKHDTPLDIVSTCLAAHVVPQEYRERRDEYVKRVLEWLPKFKSLSDFVDVFMDVGAFDADETTEILSHARNLGYGIKLHADELANTGGAKLAAKFSAISADHLTHTDIDGFMALKNAGTVPVVLPATSFFLKSEKHANVRKMLELGLPVALATDHNPGTSPTYSMVFVMQLAVFMLGMSPEEALTSATLNAATALGLQSRVGSIELNKKADLVILDAHSFVHLFYELASPIIKTVIKEGKVIYTRN